MRGVQIGRVAQVTLNQDHVDIELEIEPDQLRYIPANVGARIRAGTLFSAKFVELVYPSDPSPQRLAAGSIINSDNVSTEINTLFRDVADILDRVDPAETQATLSALAEGLRGRGAIIGQTITDTNEVLKQVNARAGTLHADRQALRRISDAYGAAAPDILTALDAATPTAAAIVDNAAGLDHLLTGVIGLARGGIDLIGSSQADLTRAVGLFRIDRTAAGQVPAHVHLYTRRRQDGPGHRVPGRHRRRQPQVDRSGQRPAVRAGRLPVPTEPPGDRGQRRTRWRAGLRFTARRRRQLAGAAADHQHRLGNRARHPAQPGDRLSRLRRLLSGHPGGPRSARRPAIGVVRFLPALAVQTWLTLMGHRWQ